MIARPQLFLPLISFALLIGSTLSAVEPVGATQPAPTDQLTNENPDVPFIVDVWDPTIDAGSEAVQEAMMASLAKADSLARAATINLPPGQTALRASAIGGQISVRFKNSTPPDVQNIVNTAAADWNAVLNIPSGAPVEIDFYWQPLDPGFLGSSRPTYIERLASLPTLDYYPVSLANALLDTDLRPDDAEIEIAVASNLYNVSNGWYAGTGPVPFDRRDLYSTMVHEIGHGLGFIGTARKPTAGQPTLDQIPMVFDRLARYNGAPIVGIPNLSSALTSNNLHINLGGERLLQLYAPGSFVNGSSFSHLDEKYQPGQPGSMMTPALGRGQTDRRIDAAVLGVMLGIGWDVKANPLTPTSLSVTSQSQQLTANWSVDLSQSGLPPTGYVVQVAQGSSVIASNSLSWESSSTTIGGLTNFEDYELEVNAIAGNGSMSSFSVRTVGHPYLVRATGGGLTRTLSWEPMNSPGTNGATYSVERSKDGGPFHPVGSTTGTSLFDPALTPGVFQYRVTGSSAGGTSISARSLFVGATTTTVRPFSLDGQVARLYRAYFDREPDASGMAYWLDRRAGGLTLEAMSAGFASGPEFAATYGSLSNADFVNLVYTKVIGRSADPEGFNYWLNQLNDGMSRGAMMVGFSDAPEYIAATGTVAPQTSVEASVYRLYVAYFLRAPDSPGFDYWVSQATSGTSIPAISAQFATSPEFLNRYGSVDNEDFVNLIYQNVLTRQPDAAGFEHWTSQLNAGASRGELMVGFSNSKEFLLATGTLP